jgi:hypothetical protein
MKQPPRDFGQGSGDPARIRLRDKKGKEVRSLIPFCLPVDAMRFWQGTFETLREPNSGTQLSLDQLMPQHAGKDELLSNGLILSRRLRLGRFSWTT